MQQDVLNASAHQSLATLPPAQRAVIALDSTATEKQLRELVTYSSGIVSVQDKDSREEAHRAGMNLKNARVAIGKVGKAAREDAQAFCNSVIAEEKRLVAITQAEEDRVFALRDGYDAKVKAEKEEAERKERERVATIRSKIDTIKGLAAASFRDASAEIAATLADLETLNMTEAEYGEFAGEASAAKADALAALRDLFDKAKAAEDEAERLAAERAVLERLRAETEAARKAEEDKLRAEREAFDAERRAFAEQQAAAARAEQERIAAAQAAEQAAEPAPKVAEPAAEPAVEEIDVPEFVEVPAANDDLPITAVETCEHEDAANFRAATRALLSTHSTEQARILFDEELQRYLAAA